MVLIAPGADGILAMRRAGQRPGEAVIVSVIGPLPLRAYDWVVEADLDTDYDWVWAINLDLWVVSDTRVSSPKLKKLLLDLRLHRPRSLYLWLDDQERGYTVWHYPKVESITRPPDGWEWSMDLQPLLEFQNKEMSDVFAGRVGA